MSPKILILDIETAPMLGYVWGLWENNVSLNQLYSDWHLLSWSAKWLDAPDILYMSQKAAPKLEDDRKLLRGIWKLLDEADVIITQNGKRFDQKKLNARFILNGMKPPSSFRHIDTCEIAKRHFGFTSNKLEYLADKLCTKTKKLTNRVYSGFSLWSACLKREAAAWDEMELYNKNDVLALEELYHKLAPWDNRVNFAPYNPGDQRCKCGSDRVHKRGFAYTNVGKYQKYRCSACGSETRGGTNLIAQVSAGLRR